jgi:lipooligosaccharide transport system permease protein
MTMLAWREFSFWMLHYRRTWRGTVVISVANPLLFLTAMGVGLGRLVGPGAAPLHGTPYLQYLAPGLLAAASMQTAYVEASRPVFNAAHPQGSYRAATATPLEPGDVHAGHLLFIAFRLLTSALAFVAVLFCFSGYHTPRTLLLAPAALLTGLAFATPIAAWAVGLGGPNPLMWLLRFVLMPLYMFSGTFFTIGQLPAGLRFLVQLTPLWHGVALCRGLAAGTATTGSVLLHSAYLAALAAIGVVLGRRAYTRRLHA